jgi:hypothetical protein
MSSTSPGPRPRLGGSPEPLRGSAVPIPIESGRHRGAREATSGVWAQGDLRLPPKIEEKLQLAVRQFGLELELTEVGVSDDTVRFHRVRASASSVALVYLDESRPDSQYPGWYVSSLCVRICAASNLDGFDKPVIIFVAPNDSILAHWRTEAEECGKVGIARDIKFARIGSVGEWEQSAERVTRFAREWTTILRSGAARPAPFDEVDRFVAAGAPGATPVKTKPDGLGIQQFFVFVASPNDLEEERKMLCESVKQFNTTFGWRLRVQFDPLTWENFSSAGQGEPEGLIIQQVLEKHKEQLVLVVCLFANRFGTPTPAFQSGTEAEFDWAVNARKANTWPEVKLFFKESAFDVSTKTIEELEQYSMVRKFKDRVNREKSCLFKTFTAERYREVVENDLQGWLMEQAERLASSRR